MSESSFQGCFASCFRARCIFKSFKIRSKKLKKRVFNNDYLAYLSFYSVKCNVVVFSTRRSTMIILFLYLEIIISLFELTQLIECLSFRVTIECLYIFQINTTIECLLTTVLCLHGWINVIQK